MAITASGVFAFFRKKEGGEQMQLHTYVKLLSGCGFDFHQLLTGYHVCTYSSIAVSPPTKFASSRFGPFQCLQQLA